SVLRPARRNTDRPAQSCHAVKIAAQLPPQIVFLPVPARQPVRGLFASQQAALRATPRRGTSESLQPQALIRARGACVHCIDLRETRENASRCAARCASPARSSSPRRLTAQV